MFSGILMHISEYHNHNLTFGKIHLNLKFIVTLFFQNCFYYFCTIFFTLFVFSEIFFLEYRQKQWFILNIIQILNFTFIYSQRPTEGSTMQNGIEYSERLKTQTKYYHKTNKYITFTIFYQVSYIFFGSKQKCKFFSEVVASKSFKSLEHCN